ncbi:MAG: carboxylating nicotinate-nucleotide diphosphorylase [Balneolaceae bacterium]
MIRSSASQPAISFALRNVLQAGFQEDLGFGDLTSSSVGADTIRSGTFVAKGTGVLSGVLAIRMGYQMLDSSMTVEHFRKDGEQVEPGDPIAKVSGPAGPLLTGERVILNILQHMSGIATATSRAVNSMQGSRTRICDTRKTLPGLRALQKYAVRCGGGYNHRFRLDDGVMIKDNHIVAAGGIQKAVEAVRAATGPMVRVEVECETEKEVREAVQAKADIIMLDNKTPDEVRKLRKMIPDSILVELSGGITPDTAGQYRDCGADYISLGSLTHSVTALDISFNLEDGKKSL